MRSYEIIQLVLYHLRHIYLHCISRSLHHSNFSFIRRVVVRHDPRAHRHARLAHRILAALRHALAPPLEELLHAAHAAHEVRELREADLASAGKRS